MKANLALVRHCTMLLLLLSTLNAQLATVSAQGTAFTYQGRLDTGGAPYTGLAEFKFTLWNAASDGSQLASNSPAQVTVPVTNGLFTATLDFGADVFTGAERWLAIGVRLGTSVGAYTALEPRQPITATPYAITAGQFTGAVSDQQLSANVARLDGDAVFTGAVVFSNVASEFTGNFVGNGAGVTNVNLATLNTLGAITPNQSQFSFSSSLQVAEGPLFSVVAVDVNGDAKADLITANYLAHTLSVMTNDGSGRFALASSPAVGDSPHAVVAADVNDDGRLDLISANSGDNTLTVLTNDGSGRFTLAASPAVGLQPSSVAAADANGDGWVDLISVNYFANSLTVLTNDGGGSFTLASSPAVGTRPQTVVAADVNEDGWLDLISDSFVDDALTVLTNNGTGGFTLAASLAVDLEPFAVAAADVNGDGKMDLISANSFASNLSVLTNDGSGGFMLASSPAVGIGPFSITAADVNGDGTVDLISGNYFVDSLTVLTNDGSGAFTLASSPSVGRGPIAVAAADVDGDGTVDLISAANAANTLTVLLNHPFDFRGNFSGSFTGTSFSGGTFGGSGAGLTNLNLPLNSGGSIVPNLSGFTSFSSPDVGGAPFGVVAADVNRDGWPDLISANFFANTLGLLLNNRSGGFTLSTSLAVGSGRLLGAAAAVPALTGHTALAAFAIAVAEAAGVIGAKVGAIRP
jgi:hypothetical protein